MNKTKLTIILFGLLFAVSDFGTSHITANVKSQAIHRPGLKEFLNSLGYFESQNKYTVVNELGMLGRYQFDPRTIRNLGFKVSQKQFLNSKKLQDTVMVAYMRENRRELKPLIKKFSGKVVRGVHVTESGILAAAHLAGSAGVWSWFYPHKYSYGTVDKNGASVKLYMKKFAGYDMRRL